MRILHVFDDYGTPGERALAAQGSVSSVVYYLARHMAKKHDVTILERDFGSLPREEFIDGIRYVRIEAGKLPKAPYELIKSASGLLKLLKDGFDITRKISKFLDKEYFDVIHMHFPFASSFLVNLKRSLREKMIYTVRADEYRLGFSKFLKPPLAARIFSPDLYLIRRVAKSVVLNKTLKEKLTAIGVSKEKLEVIPHGVSVEDFNVPREEVERVRAIYGLEGVVVMFAGTVTPRKGVEYLIKAGEILKDEKVLFLIVGNLNLDRKYAEKVINYAKRRGVKARFTSFIPYEDLKALYSARDIFVLPSLEEGFGIALTEALIKGGLLRDNLEMHKSLSL